MRAREFITEVTKGKLPKRTQKPSKGLMTYSDSEKWNSDYVQYRLGMAVAMSDGHNSIDVDARSWFGKSKTAAPYSEEEAEMLKAALKAVGAKWQDLNHGDLNSEELDSTYTTSPVADWQKSSQNKIGESASAGATSSGSVASAPAQGGGWLFGGTVGAPKGKKKKAKVIKR